MNIELRHMDRPNENSTGYVLHRSNIYLTWKKGLHKISDTNAFFSEREKASKKIKQKPGVWFKEVKEQGGHLGHKP